MERIVVPNADAVDTGLHPASRSSSLVPRPRLLRALSQATASRLTLIVAPAGYGKTTLLGDWLGEWGEAGPDPSRALRYTLSEMDNDPAHLLQGLIVGIHARLPDFAPAVDLSSPLSYALSLLLEQAAQAAGGPWLLALDDYHLITTPAVHRALDMLLGSPRWPVHLVIASRGQPPIAAIARLRVEGRLSELDEADLRFTPEEMHSFLAAGGLDLEEPALRQVVERTEGWPAALELVRQAARREPHPDLRAILGRIGDERPLFDYLAGQVLDCQPAAVRDFLRRTSLLPYLSAELCNALLETTDASAVLDELERNHLFVSPLADRPGRCYRYHALFQEFLQRRLEQGEGARAVESWHRRAAACLLEEQGASLGPQRVDDHAAAVEHLLAARDWTAAAQTIESLAEMLGFGSLPRLEPWFARLPADVMAGRPRLLLALGRMRERQGRWDEASALLGQAEAAAERVGTAEDLGQVLRWQAWVCVRQARYAEAIALCRRALALLPDGPEIMPPGTPSDQTVVDLPGGGEPMSPAHVHELAAIYNTLATCHANSGDPAHAQQYYLRSLQLYRSLGNREREALVLHDMAADIYLPQGRLREAIETEQSSLRILEDLNSYRVCFPLIILGQTYLQCGELEAAQGVLERLLRLTDAYQDTVRRGYALFLLGHLHREQGDRTTARSHYQEAWTIAEQIQELFMCFELHQGLARLALDDGDRREAWRQGQAALQRARQSVDCQLEGRALMTVGFVLDASGDTQQAEAHYRQALHLVGMASGRLDQATLLLYLADLCRREGRDEEVLAHLEHSLALSDQYGYDFLFTGRERPRALPLLIAALGQTSDVLKRSDVCRLLAIIGQEAVEPLLALLTSAPGDQVREQVVRLLGEIGDERATPALSELRRHRRLKEGVEAALARIAAAPRPPLRILALGGFQVQRGDLPIPDEAWQRRKTRLLLLYLLAKSPRRVPRDELIEALWPDLPPDSAGLALNTTFSDLRRILEPYLGKGQPSRYLARDEETLAFSPTAETRYDVAAFEQAMRAGGQAARQALELYRGDFLPEEPYVDWVLRERERLRGLYLNTLTAWLEEQVQAGAWREGAELARRILDLEPWLEEVWRALMTCLARLGRRSEALQAYQACVRALDKELDAEPSAETQALYEGLKA
ncbi:MAG: tetratricopeptide repeat protein [Anaerolineae bacterium]|nr:tetratricopeptide repeat protein [Anaerolineae bacterium]